MKPFATQFLLGLLGVESRRARSIYWLVAGTDDVTSLLLSALTYICDWPLSVLAFPFGSAWHLRVTCCAPVWHLAEGPFYCLIKQHGLKHPLAVSLALLQVNYRLASGQETAGELSHVKLRLHLHRNTQQAHAQPYLHMSISLGIAKHDVGNLL